VPNANGIIYVNSSITSGNKDGSSRSNAFIRLCDALKFSEAMNAVTPETVKQIWVAEGTYYSIHKSAEIDGNGKFTTDRDNVFSMVKEVKVYGGFIGTESDVDERDWKNNPSILSGGLLKNDDETDPTTLEDNTYHVVLFANDAGNALIDGFTITGGYANGSGSRPIKVNDIDIFNGRGGGLYVKYSSPILSNLTVIENKANFGGGIFINFASPNTINITVTKNIAYNSGGGAYNLYSTPAITNLIITENTALGGLPGGTPTGGGGGLVNLNSDAIITNMLIANNTAANGGGLFNYNSSPKLTNITIADNSANLGGGMYNGGESHPVGKNSIIWGNGNNGVYAEAGCANNCYYSLVEEKTETDSNGNISGDVDPLFIGSGNYRLSAASPVANKGNNEYYEAGQNPDISAITTDLDGNPRIRYGIVDLGHTSLITPVTRQTYNNYTLMGNHMTLTKLILFPAIIREVLLMSR
jgi:hypothetical protein